MRRTLFSLAAVALTFGVATSAMAHNDSYYHYRHHGRFGDATDPRIIQGARSGALTPREVDMLERQLARIDDLKMEARADGHVSAAERAKISMAESKFNMRLWELKHNRQRVNPS